MTAKPPNSPRTAMVICPHADDGAAFLGGTIARFAAEGWRVVLVRVTDDSKDSVGLSLEETVAINTRELRAAADLLGVAEVVELGYETDCLADVEEVGLRERIVYLFRKHRPYAVFSFDPFGIYEGNMDHIVVAQAVEEAYWVSCFDKHYPQHFDEGLEPFTPCERWYYGRELTGANFTVDVTEFMDAKINAMCAHATMMKNLIQQLRLQIRTWGKRVPMIEEAFDGDPRPLLTLFLQTQGRAVAEANGLGSGRMAESFRLARFGGFESFAQQAGVLLPGATEPPKRLGLDLDAP